MRSIEPAPRAQAWRFAATLALILWPAAAWLRWHSHRPAAALAAGGVGAALLLLALASPAAALAVKAGWLALARAVGRVNAIVLLTLFYFLVVTPLGWTRRLFGRRGYDGSWVDSEPRDGDHYRHPY